VSIIIVSKLDLITMHTTVEKTMKRTIIAAFGSLFATKSMGGNLVEPMMEPEVVEAGAGSSGGGLLVPILLLILLAAAASSGGGGAGEI